MPAADDSELFGRQAVSTFPVRAQDGLRPQTWKIKAAPLSVTSVSLKDPVLYIFPQLCLELGSYVYTDDLLHTSLRYVLFVKAMA